MTYLDAAKGYIADVLEIVFYRCDQKVFHFNELTSFNFETKNDPIVIRCGHSRHPVAFIDALKEMNMEFESAAITSDLFAMSASRVTQKAEFSSLESKRYTVNQNNQIILPFLVKDKSVSIYRLTQAQAPAPGAFSYEVKDSQTILTFDPSDFGEDDDVRVAYKRIIQDAEVMTTEGCYRLCYRSLACVFRNQRPKAIRYEGLFTYADLSGKADGIGNHQHQLQDGGYASRFHDGA